MVGRSWCACLVSVNDVIDGVRFGSELNPTLAAPLPHQSFKKGPGSPTLDALQQAGIAQGGGSCCWGSPPHDSHQPASPPQQVEHNKELEARRCQWPLMCVFWSDYGHNWPQERFKTSSSSIPASWRRAIPDGVELHPLSSRLSNVNWLALQPDRGEPKLSSLFSTPPSHPRLPKALCHCGGTGSVNPSAAS